MVFLGQLDLAEAQRAGAIEWLPDHGHLFFFCDDPWLGVPPRVKVIYTRDEVGAPRTLPSDVGRRFPERPVSFSLRSSAPSLEWLGLDAAELGLTEPEFTELDNLGTAPAADEIQHRVSGYPNEIQPERMAACCECEARGLPDASFGETLPADIEEAAQEWRLLLQLDSDPGLGMNWGDGGRLYIFVRAGDARAGDFSRTIALAQSY
jgi:uncharacterized protein YwqG